LELPAILIRKQADPPPLLYPCKLLSSLYDRNVLLLLLVSTLSAALVYAGTDKRF